MRPRSRLTSHQSKKYVDRERRRLILITAGAIVAVAGLLFGFSQLTRLDSLTISSIRLVGVDADIAPAVQAAALNALQGSYLGLFARANTLIYPNMKIRAAVKSVSPRIDSVAIKRDGSQGLEVSITERPASAVICATLPDFSDDSFISESGNEGCYFSDEQGRILKPAPVFSGQVFKRYYVPALAEATSSPAKQSPIKEFRSLQDFYSAVGENGILPEAILIKEGGEYELFAHNPPRPSYAKSEASSTNSDMVVIYFNDDRGFSEQLDNLVSFWKKMTTAAQSKHEAIEFEYVDVRYGSNVFYRRIQ